MVLEHDVRRKEELKMAFPLASMIASTIALQTTTRTMLHSLNTTRQNTETIQHLTARNAKDASRHHASQAQHSLVESVYDIEPSVRKLYLLDFCCRRDPHLEVHVLGETVAFQVRCWNCGKTSFMFDSPNKAVKQWNEMNDD